MSLTAKIVQQLNKSECKDYKANMALFDHYTFSIWNSRDQMKAFSRAGDHAKAIKQSKKIAKEIRTYSYEGEGFPGWKEAKRLVNQNGRKH